MSPDPLTRELVERIRRGEAAAWKECIDRYEGRLLAFISSRVRNQATAEDLVQETFLGFLTALPNYDDRTPLDVFLFSIAAHKLTDHLRREGRRPTLPLVGGESTQPGGNIPAAGRVASSLVRSQEQRAREETVLADCLQELIARWQERGEWERLKCLELLWVRGWSNKDVAGRLGISEQAVANHKHFVLVKLRAAVQAAHLDPDQLPGIATE
jgi:RNA polymerase sigma-70 factor (ECF subfamily)